MFMSGEIRLNQSQENIQPTQSQLATANALFYLHTIDTFSTIATQYAKRKEGSQRDSFGTTNDLVSRIRAGLEDLYVIKQQGDREALTQFHMQWGNEAYLLDSLLTSHVEPLAERRESILSEVVSNSRVSQLRAIYGLARRIPSLTEDQQVHLFELLGYDRDRAIDITKKIGVSVLMGSAITAIGYPLSGTTALLGGHESFLQSLSPEDIHAAVLASYLAHYGARFLASQQHKRLLTNENIETSPNILATCLFFLTRRMYSDNKVLQDIAIRFGTMISILPQEFALIPSLATKFGPSAVVARNISETALNCLIIVADEIWLRTRGQRRQESNDN